MKITRVSVRLVNVPDSDELALAGHRKQVTWPVATIRLGTDQGVEGLGFVFSLGGMARSLHSVLSELAGLLPGEDPTRIEPLLAKLRQAAGVAACGNLFLMAQSAIDAALWDIRGKLAGLPLWRLAGGTRQNVPAYASGQITRDLTDREAVNSAASLVDAGFRRIKFHLALPNGDPGSEVERARHVREAVGDDVELGCDVNCRWRLDQALRICSRLEAAQLAWIEDAIAFDDYDGMARLSAQLSTPIMAGEMNAGIAPFRFMLERRSVSILMIDFMMVGGIGNWLKIAGLAETFNIPVVSHLAPELQAHLVGAVPNGLMAEHKSWIWRLFEEVPAFEDGSFVLAETPGLGLSFDKKVYGDGW